MKVSIDGDVKIKEENFRIEITFKSARLQIVEDPVTFTRAAILRGRAKSFDPWCHKTMVQYILNTRPRDTLDWIEAWSEGELTAEYREHLRKEFYKPIGGAP